MSAQIFIGTGNVARSVSNIFVGVNGEARSVRRAYVGVNGRARLVWEAAPPPDPVFANNTWAQIARAAQRNQIPPTWAVGSQKDITLGDLMVDSPLGDVGVSADSRATLTLQICGFDHDDLSSGGKAKITLGMRQLTAQRPTINHSATNAGGFSGSMRYAWLASDLWNALPADLRKVIKPVLKRTSQGGTSPNILAQSMSLFLFSEAEIFGAASFSFPGEGAQYPIFAGAEPHIKMLANGTGAAGWWWTRSPARANATMFCNVSNLGVSGQASANTIRGICFGCCI